MEFSDDFLVESKSARDEGLTKLKVRHLEEQILNNVKSLFFAVWQGVGRISRQQLAEFYEVSVDNIDVNYQRHKDEFESDGVQVLRGKDLKDVRITLILTSKSPSETIYTPAGALRMGFILRDSKVAKAVRTASIRFIQGTGQQMIRQTALRSLGNSLPALSSLVQGGSLKISSPYAPYWDKMKSTLRKKYSTGGIPSMGIYEIRGQFQKCAAYTDYLKLEGIKEFAWDLGGQLRGQYPHLTSNVFSFEAGTQVANAILIFQFQDLVVDVKYIQECVSRRYLEIAKSSLGVDQACLIFVAPFGATSYAEEYIRRYLSDDYKGYVGVLTVKELAYILYEQAWNARSLGTAKGEITREFSQLRDYEFPEPPAIYEQLGMFENLDAQ